MHPLESSLQELSSMISIDPGSSGTGYAIWSDSSLVQCDNILSRSDDWMEKCWDICRILNGEAGYHQISKVVIERPSFFQSSKGGVAARSGSLVKLSILVGMIIGVLGRQKTTLVDISSWKGNVPKDIMIPRIIKMLRPDEAKLLDGKKASHVYDAVGIGLYALSRL